MRLRHLLLPLASLALFTSTVFAEDDETAPPTLAAQAAAADEREEAGPPPALTFAAFKRAVAKVQVPGFQRMPEISADGEHGLILVGPNESGFTIMAQSARIGDEFERGAAGKLSRFQHQGHDAFFAELTDDDGEKMACIVVRYPEHRMVLFIAGKPVKPREELMKLLAQVAL